MAKLVAGIEILRKGHSSDWTADIDSQLVNWAHNYTGWLESAPIALEEAYSTKWVFFLLFRRIG